MERKWTTLDINAAAYLSYRGIPIDLENIAGRIVFSTAQSDLQDRLTTAYNSNDTVPVLDFVSALKILKSRMLSMKNAFRG